MDKIINEIKIERQCQDEKWGEQNHTPEWWMQILMEEVGEASEAVLEAKFGMWTLENYRAEMIQVAAVALAAIESFDRNSQLNIPGQLDICKTCVAKKLFDESLKCPPCP